jgi:hypothetical protein
MTIPSFAGAPTPSAVNMPSPVFLTGEESLRVTTFGNASGLVLSVNGRILRPDNTRSPIQFTHVPNSNRTAATSLAALSEGWLLGVDVRVTTGAPVGNAVWVLLELVSGSGNALIPLQALAWDFVSANNPLMYPGGLNTAPVEGAGCLRAIQGTAPGAGVNISETVPAGARWDLISFLYSLTTSAAVANRISNLTIDDGANIYFSDNPNIVQAASAINGYIFAQGNNRHAAPAVLAVPGCLPVGLRLGAGHRIRTSATLLQAGDVYSAPNYLVREWFDV